MAEFKIIVRVSTDTDYDKPMLSCHVKYFLENERIRNYVVDKLYESILDELNKFVLTTRREEKSTKLSITFDKSFVGDIVDEFVKIDEFHVGALGVGLQYELDPLIKGKFFCNTSDRITSPLMFSLDTIISYLYEYIGDKLSIDGQGCRIHFQSSTDIENLVPNNILYIPKTLQDKLPYKDKTLLEGVFNLEM